MDVRAERHADALSQDEGADIDVSELLLPEPGLASDTALALREPDLASEAPVVQAQPGMADDSATVLAEPALGSGTALNTIPEQNGALGAADLDEPDEGFGDQLAEAVKVILRPPLRVATGAYSLTAARMNLLFCCYDTAPSISTMAA